MAAIAEKIEAPALPKVTPINPARFFGAELKRTLHVYNLPVDQDYADLFKPEAWRLRVCTQ